VSLNELTLEDHPVIAVKACRISDFGGTLIPAYVLSWHPSEPRYSGTTLSTTFGGHVFLRPDRAEAHELKGW